MLYYNTLNLFSPTELKNIKTDVYRQRYSGENGNLNALLATQASLQRIKNAYIKPGQFKAKLELTNAIISSLLFNTDSAVSYHGRISNLAANGTFYCLYVEFSLALKKIYTKRASKDLDSTTEDNEEFIANLEYLNRLIALLSIILHSLNFTDSSFIKNLTPILHSNSPNSLCSLSIELLQLYSKDNNLYSFNKVLILLSLCIDSGYLPSECIDMTKKEYLGRIKYSGDFLKDSVELYNDRITLITNNSVNNKDNIFNIGKFKTLEEIKDITDMKYDKSNNAKFNKSRQISKETLELFNDQFFLIFETVYSNIKYDTEYFYDKLYIRDTNEEMTNKEIKLFKSKLIYTINSILLKLLKENKTLFKDRLKDSKLMSLFYNNIFKVANKQSLFYTKRIFDGLQDMRTFDLYNYNLEDEKDSNESKDNSNENMFDVLLENDTFIRSWTDYNTNMNKLNGLRILQKMIKRESFQGKDLLFCDYSMMDNVHSELELGFRFVDNNQYKYLMKILKEEYRNKDYESQLKEINFLGYIFKETYTKIGEDWISDVNSDSQMYDSEYV
eukprot:GAHX01002252.1.p1 GENE.GAHX01002252.1~~GAHX01002252.1.p1  ORF type:complete len:573 (+),score=135.32 GAHX01002252.1:48-1721(+)